MDASPTHHIGLSDHASLYHGSGISRHGGSNYRGGPSRYAPESSRGDNGVRYPSGWHPEGYPPMWSSPRSSTSRRAAFEAGSRPEDNPLERLSGPRSSRSSRHPGTGRVYVNRADGTVVLFGSGDL
jgi:hypothetical protein